MIKNFFNVKVSIKGGNSSLIISRLLMSGVLLKNMTCSEDITFNLRYSDLTALRKAVRHSGAKVSLLHDGNTHRIHRFIKLNIPSIAAFIFALFLFFQAFQYIWSVEVSGADPELRDEAVGILENMGIKAGVRHSDLTLNQKSASMLYREVDQLSWSEFERKGSKLLVTLREKDLNEKNIADQKAHLVATKTGTIQTLSVSAGTPLVKSGAVVKKGEVLVSGYIGREGYEKAIAAEGTVHALTWYTVNVTMPVHNTVKKLTGEIHSEYALHMNSLKTPFISYKRNSFQKQIRQTTEQELYVFGYHLPLTLVVHKYKEVTEAEADLSEEQYNTILKKIADQKVHSLTGGSGQIVEEKILHEDIENGKVKLTVFYEVLENIAAPKPFTEETRE